MKKIKICYVTNSYKNCGPCNILRSMIKSIDKQKYEVYLLTLLNENDKDYIKELKDNNVTIIQLNYKKNLFTLLKFKKITNEINKYDFDIIHVHGHITSIIVQNVKAKKIITVHNKLYEDFKGQYGCIMGIIINFLYIKAMKKFDRVVSCSKSSYEVCSKYLNNCTYIHNGLWFEDNKKNNNIRRKIRKSLNIPENAKVYIFAGRYNKWKNVLTMLNYFNSSLQNNEYLISLGDIENYPECKQYSSKKIKQIGFKKNVLDYMIASDIYVSFSYTEGFPVSIIEAMHNNLLLLISNISAHNEILNIDKSLYIGEIFINDNYDDFLKKKEIVSKTKKNDSKLFQEKYLSSDIMMKKYEIEYESMLNFKNERGN